MVGWFGLVRQQQAAAHLPHQLFSHDLAASPPPIMPRLPPHLPSPSPSSCSPHTHAAYLAFPATPLAHLPLLPCLPALPSPLCPLTPTTAYPFPSHIITHHHAPSLPLVACHNLAGLPYPLPHFLFPIFPVLHSHHLPGTCPHLFSCVLLFGIILLLC